MEKDLFGPIKEYFEGYGYTCDGEVGDIDLYMEKEDSTVAVELKKSLDFKAVTQAALRQKLTETVFIGIFRPKDLFSSSFKDKVYLLKRLGIGLILVSEKTGMVEIFSEPVVSELSVFQRVNKGKKEAIASEFKKRKIKNNVGGVNRTKLITGYREDALLVLDAIIELGGESSAKQVRDLSGVIKARDIMYHNYYGWFESLGGGIYKVTPQGVEATKEFLDVMARLRLKKL